MAKFFPDNKIQEILDRIPIEQVISEYVALKPRGKSLLGLCPFHTEKTPSFSVDPTKGLYYCFGCGAGGNAFTFLMDRENLSFPEAVEQLAKRAGVMLETSDTKGLKPKTDGLEELLKINSLAQAYYQHLLWKSEAAQETRAYIEKRGITKETAISFGLGYSLDKWDGLLAVMQKRKVPQSKLLEAGLLSQGRDKSLFDRFRGRLMFPIYDHRGRVVGFGGRSIVEKKDSPKYLNSPETSIFHKGKLLYGLNLAKNEMRRQDLAILMEGYMDVIAAHGHNIGNAVASLGTAFSTDQADLIVRQTDKVVIAYDADEAGQEAVLRQMSSLVDRGCDLRILVLPEGFDPDDYINKAGAVAFKEAVQKQAIPWLEFKIKNEVKKQEISTPKGKERVLNSALPDLISLKSFIEQEHYIRLLANLLGVSETAINNEISKRAAGERYHKINRDKKAIHRNNTKAGQIFLHDVQDKAEAIMLKHLIENPKQLDWFHTELGAEYLYSSQAKDLLELILAYTKEHSKVSPARLLMEINAELKDYFSELMALDESQFTLESSIRILKDTWYKRQEESVKREIAAAEETGAPETVDLLLKVLMSIQKEWQDFQQD